jgi:cytochrome c oxidase subunit II
MAIAIALIVLVVGTVLFHFLSPWYLTPLASNWGSIDDTITISFWVTGFVFVAVNLFMVYAILRYRYNANRRSAYEPESKKLELWLTGLTSVGIAALLAPGLVVWADFVQVPEDAHEVEVVGQQWHWSFRYPGPDGVFGNVDARLVNDDNPFGMDPEDPQGQDDVLVLNSRVMLPVDQPVKLLLRSRDVLHNFQVAQFRAKMDFVPGQLSYLWLTPSRTGTFEILCAELCGIGHFAMRGKVEVMAQADFDAWLAEQPSYAERAARPPGDVAAGKALYAPCAACHGTDGLGNRDLNAPGLAGQASWYLARQLDYFKDGVRGAHPDDVYGAQMRPFAAMLANDTAVADVTAYIASLAPQIVRPTVDASPGRGARVYRSTCAACHGAEGQGIRATNAPQLAGLDDWYLQRQLNNFRNGIRGRHDDDAYGWQMAEMARVLGRDTAVDDVVAYINTLQPRDAVAGTGSHLQLAEGDH